jgi:hypothetical protein
MIRRQAIPIAAIALLSGCAGHGINVFLSGSQASGPPAWYEVGDVVSYVAQEYSYDCGECDPDPAPSSAAPDYYHWSSSNPRVAYWLAAGRLQMLDTGQTTIEVYTPHASRTFTVNVVPRITALRLTPDSVAVAIGETATFRIDALGDDGKAIPFFSNYKQLRPGYDIELFGLTPATFGTVVISPPAGYDEWEVRGSAAGTTSIIASAKMLYAGGRLGDTSKVVVR